MFDTEPISVRRASPSEVIDLRHAVLRAGLSRDTAIFDGDDAPTTRHFIAVQHDRVVGCVTLVLSECDGAAAWQLRGMAIDPACQRRGIGRQLLAAVEASLRDDKIRHLWCNARTTAVPFYERHGWVVVSEEFIIPTAGPHRRMTKSFVA